MCWTTFIVLLLQLIIIRFDRYKSQLIFCSFSYTLMHLVSFVGWRVIERNFQPYTLYIYLKGTDLPLNCDENSVRGLKIIKSMYYCRIFYKCLIKQILRMQCSCAKLTCRNRGRFVVKFMINHLWVYVLNLFNLLLGGVMKFALFLCMFDVT